MSLNHRIRPEEADNRGFIEGSNEQVQNHYRGVAKALPRSRWLSDKLIQRSISRQLHYYPGDNSVLVPERVLSGGPAFLCHATTEHYKTVIFDLVSTHSQEMTDKIREQIERGIKPELVKMLMVSGEINGYDSLFLEKLFFYWLATHQGSNSDGPIWLYDRYCRYLMTKLPSRMWSINLHNNSPKVRLPPQLIREYFCQPDAGVVQGDELLMLLDEFLGLIST